MTPDSLDSDTQAMMGDWTPRGDWLTGTAYVVKDMVTESSVVYVCVTAHIAGTFATDLAAGKWQALRFNAVGEGATGQVLIGSTGNPPGWQDGEAAAESTGMAFTVPTLAALKGLTSRPEAVIVETGQAKGVWQWELGSSTTADDLNVVECTSGTAGRYIRLDSYFSNGTVAAPALAFATDPNTGIYRAGANSLAIALGGANFLTASFAGGLAVAAGINSTVNVGTDDTIASRFQTTMAGDGNSDSTGFRSDLTISGSANVFQGRAGATMIEAQHTSGTVTFSMAHDAYVRLGLAGSTTGNLTTGAVYRGHCAHEGTGGTWTNAYTFKVDDVDLLDGTGTIGTIYGLHVGDLGHATRITSATYGVFVGNMTAGAPITAAFATNMDSTSGKQAIRSSGSAASVHAGSFRVGSTVAPTVSLDVTGDGKYSGTLTIGSSATRNLAINVSGGNLTNATFQFDDNSSATMFKFQNYGISGTNQGISQTWTYGTGGASGALAATLSVLSTEDWSTAANRSAKIQMTVAQDGTTGTAFEATTAGLTVPGIVSVLTTTAVGAGAATQAFIKASSTANLGVYYGTGDPAFTAAKGSLYTKTDATTTTTRLWVNTDGSTTWASFTASA